MQHGRNTAVLPCSINDHEHLDSCVVLRYSRKQLQQYLVVYTAHKLVSRSLFR